MAEDPKPIRDDRSELMQIRSLVRLVSFTVVAQRVLRDVEAACERDLQFKQLLQAHVANHDEWREFDGGLPMVLDNIHDRLGLLLER